MRRLRALGVFGLLVSMVAACTTRQPAQPPSQVAADAPPARAPAPSSKPAGAPQSCPAKRPEICTQQYQPVCASVDTGIRCIKAPCPSAEQKEFSNWCVACTNSKVTSYVDGPCPGGGPRPSPESMPQ